MTFLVKLHKTNKMPKSTIKGLGFYVPENIVTNDDLTKIMDTSDEWIKELMVVKKNGRKSAFDRDKLAKSIYIALKKRPLDTETVEKFISKVSRSLEELGQNEISTNTIGTLVMEGLKELDPVAYVRFASVYRNFREEKDFVQFVDKLDVYKKR